MAAAAIPFLVKAAPAIAQSVGGLFQTLFSGRKKAQREMEAQLDKSPAYTANKGISDYYQEALNRYNENPMQTAMYQNQMRNAQRVTAQGIGALQDRRSALAGIGRLAQVQNDASQNALAQAERLKESRFSTLGQAAGMKAGEERRAFDINVMTPYQRRLQMAQMKASAANARSDAGMQNLFGGAANLSMLASSGKLGGLFKKKEGSVTAPAAATSTVQSQSASPSFGSDFNLGTGVDFSSAYGAGSALGSAMGTFASGVRPMHQNQPAWNKFNNAFMPKRTLY